MEARSWGSGSWAHSAASSCAAESVEAGFEGGDAEETPFGIRDALREVLFDVVGGGEFLVDEGDEGLIGGDVVSGQDDGAAGETGFEGVVGGDEFALFRFRAGLRLGVGAVGGELGFGDAWCAAARRAAAGSTFGCSWKTNGPPNEMGISGEPDFL